MVKRPSASVVTVVSLNVGGNLQHFAGRGAVQRRLGGGHVKVGADLLWCNGVGGGVIAGVFHLAENSIVDVVRVICEFSVTRV